MLLQSVLFESCATVVLCNLRYSIFYTYAFVLYERHACFIVFELSLHLASLFYALCTLPYFSSFELIFAVSVVPVNKGQWCQLLMSINATLKCNRHTHVHPAHSGMCVREWKSRSKRRAQYECAAKCFACGLRKHDRKQQSVQIRWNTLHTLLRVCHRKSTPVCDSWMWITSTCIVQRTFVPRDFAPDCESTGLPGCG